jgi:thioredoxin
MVLDADVPVMVDFWSPSCGPCRALAPVLDELAEENGEACRIVKLNVFENTGIAGQYGVDMLPTILLFHDGQVVERLIGAQPKDVLQEALDAVES